MPTRRLVPEDLARTLRRAVEVEDAAVGPAQLRHAIAATATLLLATHDAGWRADELAQAAGLGAPTMRRRIRVARQRRPDHPLGIEVPPAPVPRRQHRATPVNREGWLSNSEALTLTGVHYRTLSQWRKAGLLPQTRKVGYRCCLYSPTDLERIMSAPRRGNLGISRPTLLQAIRAEQAAQG